MEASDSYHNRLESARSLGNRESAQNLRMSTMLVNAEIARTAVDAIKLNPLIKINELREILADMRNLSNSPGSVDRFIYCLDYERSLTQQTLAAFRKKIGLGSKNLKVGEWKEKEKELVGESIFQNIGNRRPKGKVVVLDTVLGVGLYVEDEEDFKVLDSRTNLAGHYNERQVTTLKTRPFLQQQIVFPFILSSNMGKTVSHEIGHAVNYVIGNVLNEMGGARVLPIYARTWGGAYGVDWPTNTINSGDGLGTYLEGQPMGFAISKAKNEIIADLGARGNFSHLSHLVVENGVYDNFKRLVDDLKKHHRIELDEGTITNVKAKVWQRYVDLLQAQVQSASGILKVYDEYSLEGRRKLFPYLLSQLPIDEWEKRLYWDFLAEAQDFDAAVKATEGVGGEKREKILRSAKNLTTGSLGDLTTKLRDLSN